MYIYFFYCFFLVAARKKKKSASDKDAMTGSTSKPADQEDDEEDQEFIRKSYAINDGDGSDGEDENRSYEYDSEDGSDDNKTVETEEDLVDKATREQKYLCETYYTQPELYNKSFPTTLLAELVKKKRFDHLKHPTIQEWLEVKWNKYQWFYYIDLLHYCAFLAILTLYCLISSKLGLGIVLTALALMRLAYEFYAVYRFGVKYFKDYGNYLDIALYVGCPIIGLEAVSIESYPQLSSALLIVAWINLIAMARSFEKWDIGINSLMVKKNGVIFLLFLLFLCTYI